MYIQEHKNDNVRKFNFYRYYPELDKFIQVYYYQYLYITDNGFMCAENKYGKQIYIPGKYFNSSDSPLWRKTTNKPYHIIREVHEHDEDIIKKQIAMLNMSNYGKN